MPQSNAVCRSFPFIADPARARVLILGSMPGAESLRRQEYYAYRHNAFWRIMGEIYGFDAALPYAVRTERLAAAGVALWDVFAACERAGSADSAIREGVPNDIRALLRRAPGIGLICCNGQTAGRAFARFFPDTALPVAVLPSTSPAAATISYGEKLRRYREVLLPARPAGIRAKKMAAP